MWLFASYAVRRFQRLGIWLGIWLEFDYNDTSLQCKQPAFLYSCLAVQPNNVTRSSSSLTLFRPTVTSRLKSLRDISIIKLLSYGIQISSITHTHSHTTSVLPFLALSSSQFNSRLKTVLLHHSYPPLYVVHTYGWIFRFLSQQPRYRPIHLILNISITHVHLHSLRLFI